MANSRSARKRIRASQRKHDRNRGVRSAVRTKVTKARRALLGIDEQIDSAAQLTVAISALDRAAEKGIIHANNAARRKSRLMALSNKLSAAAIGDEEAQATARAVAVGGQKGRKGTTARGRATAAAPAQAAPKPARAVKAAAVKAAPAKAAPAKPAAAEAKPPRTTRAKKG